VVASGFKVDEGSIRLARTGAVVVGEGIRFWGLGRAELCSRSWDIEVVSVGVIEGLASWMLRRLWGSRGFGDKFQSEDSVVELIELRVSQIPRS